MFIGAWDILEVIDDITMTFTSGYFLVFFAIIILMYYMVAAKDRWIILLIGSLLFGAGGYSGYPLPVCNDNDCV